MHEPTIILGSHKERAALVHGVFELTKKEKKSIWSLVEDIPRNRTTRRIAFFSDEVTKGYVKDILPLNNELSNILTRVNESTCSNFNGIAIMVYEDENDHIKRHVDREVIGYDSGVFCISLGDERDLVFETSYQNTKRQRLILTMKDSEFYWMVGAEFQKKYTHELPKANEKKTTRISLTFRQHQLTKEK